MTTATSTFPTPTANQAGAQAWLDAIHAGMLASNWVQTSDTGQLGSLASYNTTVGTVLGYRIYKWSDAQSGTLGSLYAKLTFIVGNQAVSGATMYMPKPRIELAMGTDGAGNLVAPSVTVADVDTATSSATSTVSQKRSYHSYSTANGYSLTILGADFQVWSPTAYANKIYPAGYPPIRCAILMLAVRRLTDSSGNAVAGFSAISHGNSVRFSGGLASHQLTSARITLSTATLWGMEMFTSYAQQNQLVPVALTPAVQMVNPMVVSSDGVLIPFQEVAFYYGTSTFTLDQSFTNRIAGVDRTFRALSDCGIYLGLSNCQASQPVSASDWLDKDVRTCLSFRWE